MRTREFLSKLDHDKIVKAIAQAETKTSGEIRVYLQRGELEEDALATAQRQFRRFGMHQTKGHNAVLIFIAPRSRKFAVVADARAYQKCGGDYWQHLVETMREHFQNENFTRAVLEGIEQTAELLTRHFPRSEDKPNELANEVIEE
jgi:uncharacterized membrane protein